MPPKPRAKPGGKRRTPTAIVADRFGVSRAEVCKWARLGAPHDYAGPTARHGFLWDIAELRKWLESREILFGAQKKRAEPEDLPEGAISTAEAKRRKAVADAERAELLVARLRGELLDAEHVKRARVRRIATVRAALLALPGKLSNRLVGLTPQEIERQLELEVREILEEFASGALVELSDDDIERMREEAEQATSDLRGAAAESAKDRARKRRRRVQRKRKGTAD